MPSSRWGKAQGGVLAKPKSLRERLIPEAEESLEIEFVEKDTEDEEEAMALGWSTLDFVFLSMGKTLEKNRARPAGKVCRGGGGVRDGSGGWLAFKGTRFSPFSRAKSCGGKLLW
jgi:hypothetical protein